MKALFLLIMSAFLVSLIAGCREPTSASIQAAKKQMIPIIKFLDDRLKHGDDLPDDQRIVVALYEQRTGIQYPDDVSYGKIDEANYRLWKYLRMRTSLVFVSDAPGDWHIDYDTGEPDKPVKNVKGVSRIMLQDSRNSNKPVYKRENFAI